MSLQANDFVETIRAPIANGVKLDVHPARNATFIVVAEKTGAKEEFSKKTGVYAFDFKETLTRIQTLDVNYASDVALW